MVELALEAKAVEVGCLRVSIPGPRPKMEKEKIWLVNLRIHDQKTVKGQERGLM
jgi:hypothetical protein